jgi:hypothetical protein
MILESRIDFFSGCLWFLPLLVAWNGDWYMNLVTSVKVKVLFSLFLTKHHAMMAQGGVEMQIHVFLTVPLLVGE